MDATATLTIQDELVTYFQQLEERDQIAVLGVVKTLLSTRVEEDWTAEEIDEYNRDIDAAVARMEAGDFVTYEDVFKKTGKWTK